MPEEIIVTPAPAATAPETAPVESAPVPTSGQVVPDAPKGSSSMVAEMDALINPPKPVKPAEPVKDQKGKAKAEAEPEKAKVEPAKPAVTPVKEKDPVSLRKRLAEIEQEYSGFKLTAKQEQEKLSAKIAEFEKRKYLTPEQEKEQEALGQEARQLKAELYARDHREDPAFKQKYESKWLAQYEQTKQMVQTITVVTEDPTTGEAKSRTASESDLKRVMALKDNPIAQQDMAEQLFGKYHARVLSSVNRLEEIEGEATQEIQTHKLTYEEKRKQQEAEAAQTKALSARTRSEVETELRGKYAEYFGNDEANPESNEAFQKGMELVKVLENGETMPVEDRSARETVRNHWAAAFPRMVVLLNKARAEAEEARKQIAELRGTDPGSGGEGPAPTEKTEGSKGTEDLIKEFDKINQ